MAKSILIFTAILISFSALAQWDETQSGKVTTTNNVGIGTTNPDVSLQIESSGTIGSSNLANSWALFGSTIVGIGIDPNEIMNAGGNLYIGTTESNNLYFRTNGTNNRLTIDASGNIGIGTSNPATKLHVNGSGAGSVDFLINGRMRSGDSNNSGGIWVGDGNELFIGQQQADKVGFWTGGSWRLIANTSGDIGVGTSSPSAKLHVNGSGAGSVDFLVNGRMRSGDSNNSGGIWMGE